MSTLGLLPLILTLLAPATQPNDVPMNEITLDHESAVDPDLQVQLVEIDETLRERFDMTTDDTAVGLLDLKTGRVAMIHPDRIEYAASVPKIGILLAWFELHPDPADLDDETRQALGEMIKPSSNEQAARFSREMGLEAIQDVLNHYGLYDKDHGGGLWVGKHYGPDSQRIGDPVADHSHAATVRQLLRYYLMLAQGRLVSPAASKAMREIFATGSIEHLDSKFVAGLADRDVEILRKSGTWETWFADTALITGDNRHYILVALTNHAEGEAYLQTLAPDVDDLMSRHGD